MPDNYLETEINTDGIHHEAMKSPVVRDLLRRVLEEFEAIPSELRVWTLSSIVLSVVTNYTADPARALEFFVEHVRENLGKAVEAHRAALAERGA